MLREKLLLHLSLHELPERNDLHGKTTHRLSVPKPSQEQCHMSPREGMFDLRVALHTSPRAQPGRVCVLDTSPLR